MAASIKCDERPFKGGVWGGFAPPAKNRGVWGAAPPSQNFSKKRKKKKNIFYFFPRYLPHGTLLFSLIGAAGTLEAANDRRGKQMPRTGAVHKGR